MLVFLVLCQINQKTSLDLQKKNQDELALVFFLQRDCIKSNINVNYKCNLSFSELVGYQFIRGFLYDLRTAHWLLGFLLKIVRFHTNQILYEIYAKNATSENTYIFV